MRRWRRRGVKRRWQAGTAGVLQSARMTKPSYRRAGLGRCRAASQIVDFPANWTLQVLHEQLETGGKGWEKKKKKLEKDRNTTAHPGRQTEATTAEWGLPAGSSRDVAENWSAP